MRLASLPLLAALGLLVAGCKKPADERVAGTALPVAPPVVVAEAGEVGRRIDLVDQLSRCEVRHRGVLIDTGSPAADGLAGWRLGPETQSVVEREGANWLRVTSRNLSYRFTLDDAQTVFVSARIRSLGSKSVAVTIDGKVVTTLGLPKGQTKIVSSGPMSNPLGAGMHTIGLRFAGVSRDGVDPVAELDWVRVGFPDDDASSFAAPTATDILQNLATIDKVPHRSLALRTPSSVRCMVAVPAGARLRLSAALVGSGEGAAEVRVLTDGQPAEVLKSLRMLGSEKPAWTDLDLPLDQLAGRQVMLELVAAQGGRGSRMLFGDPRIVAPGDKAPPAPRAKAVIVAVVSSLHPSRLPPWAPDRPLPTFDALARQGVLFERYRGPTTVVGGVMATLVTGLQPRQHGVEDPFARLPDLLPTLPVVARDASVHTAMFTSQPASFEAFGFARGWDRFEQHSPVSPALGTRPFDDLIAWLGDRGAQADKGLLAVVHTRGIHPPFDLSPGEFAQLPPHPEREYAGPLDPRRAGQVLAKYRPRKRGPAPKWTETDAMRLHAMMDLALVQTDRGLSNLIDALRKAQLWNDTLLIVTSDVAAGEETPLPFAEVIEPGEEALRVPLYVKFPGGARAGERVGAPAQAVDVAATVLEALGLGAAAAAGGQSLFAMAERGMLPVERMQVATLGERSFVRWGDWRLVAREGAAPVLCDLRTDARCEHDVAERWPSVVQAMWREAYDHEAQARPPRWQRPRREPATLDADMAAALAVWGR